jgi:hypothetical protein
MVEETFIQDAVVFLDQIGMYNVILPFLLVFTIVFAILEKTKIFGVDNNGVTKKNINAIIAFIAGFLVIASTQLVSAINEIVANVVLVLILVICFMMLIGAMHTGEKEFSLENFPGWIKFLMYLTFVGIVLIFLNALDWLDKIIGYGQAADRQWLNSLIFLGILGFIMWLIIREPGKDSGGDKKD